MVRGTGETDRSIYLRGLRSAKSQSGRSHDCHNNFRGFHTFHSFPFIVSQVDISNRHANISVHPVTTYRLTV